MEGFWLALGALIVVAGPWKAAIVFAEKTTAMEKPKRRRVAGLTVLIATVVGVLLLLFGKALVDLFKIKPAGFLIGAGLIVVVFAIRMVIAPAEEHISEHRTGPAAMSVAVYPLAIPLLITPPAVAALTALGVEAGVNDEQLFGVIAALLVVMAVNLAAFWVLARYEDRVAAAAWDVAGRLLGIFLAAFGVTIILDGFKLIE